MLHLNEGHSVFAILERIRRVMAQEGLSFEEAQLAVRPGLLFTTHTPVAAGHDYFPDAVARRFLAPYARQLATSLDTLVALGRVTPDWEGDSFCPTVFAMRMVGHRNGVSRLHGRVTRRTVVDALAARSLRRDPRGAHHQRRAFGVMDHGALQ